MNFSCFVCSRVAIKLLVVCELAVEVKALLLQTGSGKTYTMMGEIKETEGHLTEDSGITPRVFDHLFTRIKAVRYLD